MNQSLPPFAPFGTPTDRAGAAPMRVLWCDADAGRMARATRLLAGRAIVEASPDTTAAIAAIRAIAPDLVVAAATAAPALAAALRAQGRLDGIPLIAIAASAGEEEGLARAGAMADVLAEPIADHALVSRVSAQLEIVRLRRTLAQRELESETWLGLTLQASGLGVWHARISSGELHMDANLAAMFGWPREPLLVRDADWLGRIHPDDRPRVTAELMARRQDLKPLEIDFRTALPDGSVRSLAVLGAVVRGADDVASRSVGVARDVTDRVRDAERLKLLLGELNHRVRNTLASVLALAQQTAQDAPTVPAFIASFRARVLSLGVAHNLLTRGQWQGAALRELVETILAPDSAAGAAPRIEISGPPCDLAPQKALAMTLGLHELATNARKYGCFAAPGGHLSVAWSIVPADGGDRLSFVWRERGGTPVKPPARSGFGTRLLRRALGGDLGGMVRLEFDPEGLTCAFDFPLDTAP